MSQQGKPYTDEQKQNIMESLRPFLEMGFSRSRACKLIGLDESTLSKWAKNDKSLSMKLEGWGNTLAALAIANVHKALQVESETEDARIDNSWKYLERRVDEFKPKSDVTSDNEKVEASKIFINSQGVAPTVEVYE